MATLVNVHVKIDKSVPGLAKDVFLSITNEEQAEWSSVDDAYTIQFTARTPFQKGTFQVPAHGSIVSGPLNPATKPKEKYKYDILQNGKVVSDPQIIIKN
jgi:hypothetical protein